MLRPRFKLRLAALLAAATFGLAGGVRAQHLPMLLPQVHPQYTVRWTDGVVLAGAIALSALPLYQSDSLASPCPCDIGGLWGIDRGVVGPVDDKPARASNAVNIITVGLASANVLLSRPGESWNARGRDMVVFTQAVTIASGLTQAIKTLTQRPRPYVYDAQPVGNVAREDLASFPSGHTSSAFAAAAAYWSMMHRRGQAHRHKVEIASLFLLAATTGALRVTAHKHFPTDVVAGAALGTAVGWTIPAIHPMR